MQLYELLDKYFTLSGFVGYIPYRLWFAPLSITLARMEFRIFHNIFCETYKVYTHISYTHIYIHKPTHTHAHTYMHTHTHIYNPQHTHIYLNPLSHTHIHTHIYTPTQIQKTAFAFNEYVEKVFEKNVMTMIEIRTVDWMGVIGIVLLNWARYELDLNFEQVGV
jgi:hypothetical protein